MEENILVWGKGEKARFFCEMAEKAGIAVTFRETVDKTESCLGSADIIVRFLEDSRDVAAGEGGHSITGPQIWLCESINQSVTVMANQVGNPARCVGFSLSGFFPEKKLVELIGGEKTDSDAVAAAKDLFEKIGFTVVIAQDRPGSCAEQGRGLNDQ